MIKKHGPFAALGFLFFALHPYAHSQHSFDFSGVEKTITAELQQTFTPGAAVAVVSGDRVIFAKGFGVASVETKAPVTPDMLFRLGSTTKMFTATALLMLAEQGKLRLDEPIGKYVKGLHPAIASLTAHQLLSHTAGFWDEVSAARSDDESALASEVRSWNKDRLFTAPGSIYSYASPGYSLAGFVVEELGGKSFADQVSESVFKPLGMNRSTFRPAVAMTYPLAKGHEATNAGVQTVIRAFANNTKAWPAGSMYSNVPELAQFTIAFMNGGRVSGKQILTPSLVSAMSALHTDIPGQARHYGYGLEIYDRRGLRIVSHSGAHRGYGSVIRMVPEKKFAVIVIGNRSSALLTRTVEAATETVLALEPEKNSRAPAVTMTEQEMDRHVGTFAQADSRITVGKDAGKLYVQVGQARYQAIRLPDGRHQLVSPTGDRVSFAFVGGNAEPSEYVHYRGRGYKRVRQSSDK